MSSARISFIGLNSTVTVFYLLVQWGVFFESSPFFGGLKGKRTGRLEELHNIQTPKCLRQNEEEKKPTCETQRIQTCSRASEKLKPASRGASRDSSMTCWTMLASGTLTPIDAVAFARRWVSAVAKSRGDIFPLLSRAQTQLLLAAGKINAAQQKPMTQGSHRKAVCVFVQ